MKTGYQTTEFWTSLVGMAIGLLIVAGVISPEQGGELEVDSVAIITLLIPMVYTVMRTLAKWGVR